MEEDLRRVCKRQDTMKHAHLAARMPDMLKYKADKNAENKQRT